MKLYKVEISNSMDEFIRIDYFASDFSPTDKESAIHYALSIIKLDKKCGEEIAGVSYQDISHQINQVVINKNIMGNLKKFIQSAEEKGGATFNINTSVLNPDKGFATAVHSRSKEMDEFDDKIIQDYIYKNIDLLGRNDYYLGLWRNKYGVYVLDVVKVYDDLREALLSANKSGDDFIFDFKNNEEIKTPVAQRAGTHTQRRTHLDRQIEKIINDYE